MATRKQQSEERPNMIETFKEFKDMKNIDRTTLVSVLEESFRNVIAKIYGSDESFDVIVNPDKGDFEIYRNRVVVADNEVQDDNKEIGLTEARKIEPDYEIGEDVSEPVNLTKFGRRVILNLRQTLASKVLELEHDALYNTKTESEKSYPAKSIKPGNAKYSSSTKTTTNSSSQKANKYQETTTEKAKPSEP